MLEKEIEAHLVKRMKEIGGECYKWSSPGNRGVPDRICFFPNRKIVFVELKAPSKKPTKLQLLVGTRIGVLGHHWYWCDTKGKIDELVDHYAKC